MLFNYFHGATFCMLSSRVKWFVPMVCKLLSKLFFQITQPPAKQAWASSTLALLATSSVISSPLSLTRLDLNEESHCPPALPTSSKASSLQVQRAMASVPYEPGLCPTSWPFAKSLGSPDS